MEIKEFFKWEQATKDTIDVKKIYVDMADDLVAGVLLSQIVFWFLPNQHGKTKLRVVKNGVLWLAKGRDEWWDECRIKPRQFDTSIKKLEENGLVEKKVMKFNGDTKVHIRILWENFLPLLQVQLNKMPDVNPDLQNGESVDITAINESVIPDLHNESVDITAINKFVNQESPELQIRESRLSKSVNPLTEITTEIYDDEDDDLNNRTSSENTFIALCRKYGVQIRLRKQILQKLNEQGASIHEIHPRVMERVFQQIIEDMKSGKQISSLPAYFATLLIDRHDRAVLDSINQSKPICDVENNSFPFYNWLEN